MRHDVVLEKEPGHTWAAYLAGDFYGPVGRGLTKTEAFLNLAKQLWSEELPDISFGTSDPEGLKLPKLL